MLCAQILLTNVPERKGEGGRTLEKKRGSAGRWDEGTDGGKELGGLVIWTNQPSVLINVQYHPRPIKAY